MSAIHPEKLKWTPLEFGVQETSIFPAPGGQAHTRISMVEVAPGGYIPAHRHEGRHEFLTVLLSAGAQMQIGDRIYRPTAGQVFERSAGEILALTNDSHHPFRYSVVRFHLGEHDLDSTDETNAGDLEDTEA